jgi:nitronate monooxygenase
MGAGIPREIPGALDRLARHEDVSLRVHVEGATAEDDFQTHFSPRAIIPSELPTLRRPTLKRPKFLAIIASSTLAVALFKKSTGRVDGFVIEGPTSGGHNAPPRGTLQLNEGGEPIYGSRDVVDLGVIRQLGLPFWLAGSYGAPEQLQWALQAGAAGVQVGTAFAFCHESGMAGDLKSLLIHQARRGDGSVFTDPRASPAGFPFKVVRMEASLSESDVYAQRPRLCDLGYLRSPYKKTDGTLGYRWEGEPVDAYLQ